MREESSKQKSEGAQEGMSEETMSRADFANKVARENPTWTSYQVWDFVDDHYLRPKKEMRELGLPELHRMSLDSFGKYLNALCAVVHEANKKWWSVCGKCNGTGVCGMFETCRCEDCSGCGSKRNFGEAIALCHSELSEALEGHRKDLMDDKLPHRKMAEVELADCIIRIFDLACGFGFDLGGAFAEKMAYNAVREDHKLENRMKEGGKKY